MKAQVTDLEKSPKLEETINQGANPREFKDLTRKGTASGLRPTRSIYRAKTLRPKSCLPQAILRSKPE